MKAFFYLGLVMQLFGAETGDPADTKPSQQGRTISRPTKLTPPDVLRGDRVSVTVMSGAVQLKFDAETESTGHIGETVIVKNPENGRRFVARVEDKGKVVVKK